MAVKDINDVITDVGMGRYQWTQIAIVGTLYLLDGAEILIASSVLNSLEILWHIGPAVKGAFVSLIFVGVLFGTLCGGILGDTIGRRRTVLVAFSGVTVFGLASSQASSPMQMLLARFCFGMMFGMGTSTGISLTVESAPGSWRGHVVNIGSLYFVLGEIFAGVLLLFLMPSLMSDDPNTWRWVTALGVAPGVLVLPLAVVFLQESPHWLLSRGRNSDALAALHYIAAINGKSSALEGVDGVRARTAGEDQDQVDRAGSAGTGETGTPEIVPATLKSMSLSQRLAVPFREEYRSILFGGCFLLFTSNFTYYGLMYALPIVFAHMTVPVSPAFQVFVTALCDIPGVLLTWACIRSQNFGYRDSLVGLAVFCVLSFGAMTSLDLGTIGERVSLPASYLAKYVCAAFFTLVYVYLSEVFPSSCRTTALSICIGCGRIGAISAPSVFQTVTTASHYWRFFTLCSGLSLICVLVIRSLLHFELKGQPLEDVAPLAKDGACVRRVSVKRGSSSSAPLAAPGESQ